MSDYDGDERPDKVVEDSYQYDRREWEKRRQVEEEAYQRLVFWLRALGVAVFVLSMTGLVLTVWGR